MSDNDGQGWGLTVMGAGQPLSFYATSFVNATTGWAVGAYQATGSILHETTLSGFVWTLQSAPTTNPLYGVSFTSVDSGTPVGSGGTIVHTTDGGAGWTIQQTSTQQSLNAVSFVDSHNGIAVGDSGTILLTTNGGLTGVAQQIQPEVPGLFHLEQNYPNPFNPGTKVRFTIREAGLATLKVFDVLGNEVATLVDEALNAGTFEVSFDAGGRASGTYFYRLRSGNTVLTRKMALLR
jgi:hypothetical protein